jgi:hypothetical protein
VQIRAGEDADALLRGVAEFAGIGVTEPLLVLAPDEPVAQAERLAALLPRLRSIG